MRPYFCEEWGNRSGAYKLGLTRMPQLNSEDTKTRRFEGKAMPTISPKAWHPQVTSGRAARIQACRGREWSRLVEKVVERPCLAGSLRAIGLLIESGEFARRRVVPHSAIPLVIGPAAQFSGDLRPLFQREPLDRRPDFLNRAHTQLLWPEAVALQR